MASVNIILRDPDTGVGLPDQTLKLRHDVDGYASDVYTLTQIDSGSKPGAYTVTDVTTGTYKLWVNGSEDNTFGGDEGRQIIELEDIIWGKTDEDGDYFDSGGREYRNAGEPTADTSLIRQVDGDARYPLIEDLDDYVDKTSTETISGTKTFNIIKVTQFGDDFSMGGWEISGLVDPTVASAAARKQWVEDQIDAAVSAIVVTPYQESPNKIRLIPGGSTKTGQVYTSWNDAAGYLKSLTPSSTKRFMIEIDGMGVSGSTSIVIAENDAGSPPTNYFNNYISYFIPNRYITLLVPDDTMSVSALGNTSIEGGTMYISDVAANPVFTNLHFVNVYFDLVCASVVFTNCKFENCFIKVNDDGDASATFTDCVGSGNTSNQVIPSTVTGWGEKPKADF